MKKVVMLAVVVFTMAGCGVSIQIGSDQVEYSTTCIDNVEYIVVTSGVTVAYTPDGKVKGCSNDIKN